MQKLLLTVLTVTFFTACKQQQADTTKPDEELQKVFSSYYGDRMKLFPIEATARGYSQYNDQLPVDFSNSYRDTLKTFYANYLQQAEKFKGSNLSEQDQLSYDVFVRELKLNIEGFQYPDNFIPFQQFWGLPLSMGQMGSGDGIQPFKTVKDYDNWLQRAARFAVWSDSAIVYFKKGIDANYVLPKALVVKMVPEMRAMVSAIDTASLFYKPAKNFPASFSADDKQRLQQAYKNLVSQVINPTYTRLGDFLQNEYLPKARTTSGIGALAHGGQYYQYLIKTQTTTNRSPEDIYQTGLSEVERISKLQDSVKNLVGYKSDMNAFFEYMRTDKRFMPYKAPQEVLDAFHHIYDRIKPNLSKMFHHVPKTAFEIRQTEAFRAASASAEYNEGSPDGSRPGIFYIPIINAKTFNTTSGMESLFLHEAIPGHHYQISLQQEDTTLPLFRRYGGNNAYVEGWALYCESLGKELGLYTDPYQYMAALGDEIHRAVRLVVDVAIHTKGMSREEAIKYMMSHEAIDEQGATAEIERYMAIPGQALGYKIGALKIRELRNKYQQQLGSKFNIADFHDNILKDGALPLEMLEQKMDKWAANQK